MLNPTQMRNLIIGTIFVVGAAVWATLGEDSAGPLEARGEPLLPGITERLGRLTRLELEGSDEKTVLTLGETGWVLTLLGDYPVDASRIRGFLQGLVRARRFEEKTANKSLFERMGLGQEATTASFFDDGEAPFLLINIGKRADRSSGNAALTFVYLEADGRAWTVKDFAEASPEALFWIDRVIARIPVKRIRRLEIKRTGGEDFTLLRSEPGADQTQLMLADGIGQPADPFQSNRILSALAYLDLEDIAPAVGLDADSLEIANLTFTTFDGLKISLRLIEKEGVTHALFSAEFDEGLIQIKPGETLPVAGQTGQKEADSLNRKWQGRAYIISSTRLAELTLKSDAFIVKLVPEGGS